jgi:dTDP-D-glucose 4,6-dehydratase
MHAEFGWQPSKDYEKNIGETIDWYCIKLQKLL